MYTYIYIHTHTKTVPAPVDHLGGGQTVTPEVESKPVIWLAALTIILMLLILIVLCINIQTTT